MLTFFQAIVVGIIQGVSELFPVSSLGHSVLLPALFGWNNLVTDQSQGESFYLAFVVGLHVATALALIAFFWRDWVRIIGGFFVTLRTRRIETPDQRMAWMLVLATIPVGIAGLLFEHQFRTLFAKPEAAAIFLTINGFILVGAELLKRRTRPTTLDLGDATPAPAGASAAAPGIAVESAETSAVATPANGGTGATGATADTGASSDTATAWSTAPASKSDEPGRNVATLKYREAVVIGSAQILALFAGISRSGVTMAAGLARGLSHEDARGSPSCWPPRSSWPPASSRSPICSERWATGSAARSWPEAWPPPSPPTFRCGSWSAGSPRGPCGRSPPTAWPWAQP